METSKGRSLSIPALRPFQLSLRRRLKTASLQIVMCLGMVLATGAGTLLKVPAQNLQPDCPDEAEMDSTAPTRIDLAFIIDRSGSIAGRGQTYNIELEGIIRALRDPTVIPPNGSIAIAVVTFSTDAVVNAPFREIRSAVDAERLALEVEAMKCETIGAPVAPCPVGDTNYTAAINTANDHLNQNFRVGARRILLMSSDGEPTDAEGGARASDRSRIETAASGIPSELDVILIGLDPDAPPDPVTGINRFQTNKAKVDRIVFPQPTSDLPGATLAISAGECNLPGAIFGTEDCDRQADEFAEFTRRILRGHVPALNLVVTTDADTLPREPVAGTLSLRQAIETANLNEGGATITFADNIKGRTIRPLIPLPALTAPEITIDGIDACEGEEGIDCFPSVTIDGDRTDTTKGERHGDGILIRSNHDVVRGLRIINFQRAGVAIDPVCPFDIAGRSLVERNKLENNALTGVLVRDIPLLPLAPNFFGFQNTGNTILGNTILRDAIPPSAALIDLIGEGRTPNDPGDFDFGPNTLLNFPDQLDVISEGPGPAQASSKKPGVAAIGNSVTITGQANGPLAANATVEIFGITKLRPVEIALGVIELIAEAVSPLRRVTTDATGAFRATGVPLSPTGGYTATLTDRRGNTSELRFSCAGLAIANFDDLPIKFRRTSALSEPGNNPPSAIFTIGNAGCAPLDLVSVSITRKTSDTRINPSDDSSPFSIIPDQRSFPMTIPSGESRSFTLFFNPLIPPANGIPSVSNRIPASEVLSKRIKSTLTFTQGDGSIIQINLSGRVETAAQFINPAPGQSRRPPIVTLTRSGDEFIARFSIWDSNLDVHTARYEFFDGRGHAIRVEPLEASLVSAIRDLVPGQSFTLRQNFTNANEHPEATTIRVTVLDGETSVSATSGPISLSGNVTIRSFPGAQRAALILPTLRIGGTRRSANAGNATPSLDSLRSQKKGARKGN